MSILLDTNICIKVLRREVATLKKLDAYADSIYVSAISIIELVNNIEKKEPEARRELEYKRLGAFLQRVEVLPWDAPHEYVALLKLKPEDWPGGPICLQIAAQAVKSEATLISGDIYFPELPTLDVRDDI